MGEIVDKLNDQCKLFTLMLSQEAKSFEHPFVNLAKELEDTRKQLSEEIRKKEYLQRHVKEFASKAFFDEGPSFHASTFQLTESLDSPVLKSTEEQGYSLAMNTLSRAYNLSQKTSDVMAILNDSTLQVKTEKYFLRSESPNPANVQETENSESSSGITSDEVMIFKQSSNLKESPKLSKKLKESSTEKAKRKNRRKSQKDRIKKAKKALEYKQNTNSKSIANANDSASNLAPNNIKIVVSDYSKNKSFKKSQYCTFCGKQQVKISRHLKDMHANEPEVQMLSMHSSDSTEWKKTMTTLKNRGNYSHNM